MKKREKRIIQYMVLKVLSNEKIKEYTAISL
jgi:hypothetical protein